MLALPKPLAIKFQNQQTSSIPDETTDEIEQRPYVRCYPNTVITEKVVCPPKKITKSFTHLTCVLKIHFLGGYGVLDCNEPGCAPTN